MTQGYTDDEMNELFEEFISKPGTTVREHLAASGGDTDEWIYPGLVCDSYTCIVGTPKSGKSRFAVNLAAAYSRGEPLLGIEPTTGAEPKNVLIVGTEGNLIKEYKGRLFSAGADLDRVAVERVPTNGPVPAQFYARARYGAIDLVIVDNSDGFKGGESNVSDLAVANLKAVIEPFNMAGVPVVVIHHANKSTGDVLYNVMGNTTYRATFREIIGIRKLNGSAVEISTAGNIGEPTSMKATFGEDHRLTLIGADDTTEEKDNKGASDVLARIAQLAVDAPEEIKGKGAIARYVAAQLEAEGIENQRGSSFAPRGIEHKLNGMVKSKDSTLRYDEETKRYAG